MKLDLHNPLRSRHLLLFLLSLITTLLLGLRSLGLLSPDTTWATAAKWRSEGEVDVLLGVESDNERWDVDDLLADAGSVKSVKMSMYDGVCSTYRM
jgi:hypothetical protein